MSVQQGVTIKGDGPDAVLVVEGMFTMVGTRDRPIEIINLWIEPAPKFDTIRLDMCEWISGGGFRNPGQNEPVNGVFTKFRKINKRPLGLAGTPN